MEKTTDHNSCNILVDILEANKISNVVISPGSRNAPLIMAFARNKNIDKHVVVDERAAAFMALGMAQETQQTVALVCTSGTALLNYAPAIAEAYYQHIPLLVISADRPMEWIGQDDSQTILQPGVYSNYIKATFDIPAYYQEDSTQWYINRVINDACFQAKNSVSGPVHLNVQLVEPLCNTIEREQKNTRIINTLSPAPTLGDNELSKLVSSFASCKKVMIVGGFSNYDSQLQESLIQISKLPNVVVLAETITNISGGNIIRTIDRVLSQIKGTLFNDFAPELLITFGGSLVSRVLKEKLRRYSHIDHWHIGLTPYIIDTMKSLKLDIKMSPNTFFSQISSILPQVDSDYNNMWKHVAEESRNSHNSFVLNAPWSDIKAFNLIFNSIPSNYNLQLSNGTSIRYAQLFGDDFHCKCNCNRGVAGIDGCTSTALGASLASTDNTLLITGDMSFSYDLGGLASQYKNPRFKIIVMNNGGGGIFRFIKGTSSLPELEDYFEVHQDVNIKGIASAFGYEFMEAKSESELKALLDDFYTNDCSTILCIPTPREENALILREYFKRNDKN